MGSFDRVKIWLQPQDLPRTGLEDMLLKRERKSKNNRTLIFYMRFYTSKYLSDITHKGSLKPFLRQHKIWMKAEAFGARPVSTIGFLSQVHPKYTRYAHLTAYLRRLAVSVPSQQEEKDHWMGRNPDYNPQDFEASNPVPPFTVYSAKRSATVSKVLTTEVLNIRCATEDRAWLTHLLCLVSFRNSESKFIPQGRLPKHNYENILGNHKVYMDECISIPIVGLSSEAESTEIEEGGIVFPLGLYILERTGAHSLEPTNRTEDLGKYFLVLDRSNFERARNFLDTELPDLYRNHIRQEVRQAGFAFPRRSNQPLFRSSEEVDYIQRLCDEAPLIPVTEPRTERNYKEVLLCGDDVAPPPKVRRRSEFDSPFSAQSGSIADQAVADLSAKLEALEYKLNKLGDTPAPDSHASRVAALERKQDAAFSALEKRMESELEDIKESNKIAIESSQQLFIKHLNKVNAEFTNNLHTQANNFSQQLQLQSVQISGQISQVSAAMNEATTAMHASQEQNRLQLFSDIKSLLAPGQPGNQNALSQPSHLAPTPQVTPDHTKTYPPVSSLTYERPPLPMQARELVPFDHAGLDPMITDEPIVTPNNVLTLTPEAHTTNNASRPQSRGMPEL